MHTEYYQNLLSFLESKLNIDISKVSENILNNMFQACYCEIREYSIFKNQEKELIQGILDCLPNTCISRNTSIDSSSYE